MATAEHPMWVTKRFVELGNQTGFVMVPDDLRPSLIAANAAQDTFDFRAFPDTSPLGPDITDITVTPGTVTVESPVDTTAATLAIVGGTLPASAMLLDDDGGNFKTLGMTILTARAGLVEGDHSVQARVADAGGRSLTETIVISVGAAPLEAPAAQTTRTTRK